MVVIAVFLTFALCFLIDWLLRRSLAARSAPEVAPAVPVAPILGSPSFVGGFELQEEMAFHPGHAWALVEGPDRVRVGLDDFARKLIGPIDRLELPAVGQWLTQGRSAWSAQRGQRRAQMLSPVSGQVIAVNPALRDDPGAAGRQPYGEGWLLQVRVPELRANLNNLLAGGLARRWLEDVAMRLRLHFSQGEALSFPDGGTAVDELAATATPEEWAKLSREFLLTGG